jgi:cellulose synthase (UDP-forming)
MVKGYEESDGIIKVSRIKKTDVWTIRFLIVCALIVMSLFIWWFAKLEHVGYLPIYLLLTTAMIFKLVKMLHEWYHYWHPSIPEAPELKTKYTADMLTTACPGEPKEMIIRTLHAMVAVRYPHTNYLCDEGNDPELKAVCDELGIVHVTREKKVNAKAGNINNALRQATGDIAVVLDPDHIPVPEFLDRVLPYFEDPKTGYVQCVQGYYNQSESIIARGAAEQTYHFYGPMMMCMNTYGTVQAIGANCAFRREAIDSIGGHAAGLSEDMHTAMQLHAKGWKSVYIPEMLTKGLVPSTLSAYYQQQLKWSRGTFELLFRTYPSLHKNFTLRQKIHYITLPLYFLFGLINFFDMLVPLLALSFAQVPWEVDIENFGMFFIPLCCLSLVIRLFAQRWLLQKHERGLHLAGGILRTATWWIFLIGFIYAIFNIKVPYIPTPKGDDHQNYVKLCLPNIIIALICSIGIVYGLAIDWSPYSMAMAFYAVINISILGFITLLSQQRFLDSLKARVRSIMILSFLNLQINTISEKVQSAFFATLRNGAVALIIGISILLLSYNSIENEDNDKPSVKQKDFGGFYSGITMNNSIDNEKIKRLNADFNNRAEVISFVEKWNENTFAEKNLYDVKKQNAIPLLNWEISSMNDDMWKQISEGKFNKYLESCAANIRAYGNPVFLNFAAGFDTPETKDGKNSAREFVKAWQFCYTFFNNLGVSNITWVWSPKYAGSIAFYPGSQFVDWVGVSCLNYGEKGKKNYYSFAQLYFPFRDKFISLQKPFMITEFGSPQGKGQAEWFDDAFKSMKEKYREIRSLVFSDQQKNTVVGNDVYVTNFNFYDSRVLKNIEKGLAESSFQKEPVVMANTPVAKHTYHSPFVEGGPRNFKLMIKGKPFYIKGVAYNTAHDWRDGNMPLTRRQVKSDMQKMKDMGANTIRRYDHGIYDRNVINIAEEYNLNVLYGFWFDPAVDYYKDSVQVQEYIKSVEDKVEEYKDRPSILAWSLGNETWGLLKHSYAKPCLTKVRQSYIGLIEHLAKRIHEIDPTRPVFSCLEHEEYQLPGELAALHDGAPSVDVIGINSYYREQISNLNSVFYQFDSVRPYLVSEFGPRGYWDPHHNRVEGKSLIEDSEAEKAAWYGEQWKKYVFANKGYNIGGVAYCWHDRMEGSNTWFGITDYKGRVKLSYYALKEAWTGEKEETLPSYTIVMPEKIKPGNEYLFSALPSKKTNKEITYQWSLNKDEYLKKVDALTYEDEGKNVLVKIPEKSSNYRLYLYVSDEDGNVTTASLPIKVD